MMQIYRYVIFFTIAFNYFERMCVIVIMMYWVTLGNSSILQYIPRNVSH